MIISWFGKYFWEEPPLIGNKKEGTGAIFFSGCNLHCVFCQNYQISQQILGKNYTPQQLSNLMIDLQEEGVVSIDLVTPIVWWSQIREAVVLAKNNGLKIPIIWNSNGYEDLYILKKLEGLIDIYLPDFKYGDDEVGLKYSGIENYSEITSLAISEMIKQNGMLKFDKNGIAEKGIIVRHLILPNNIENSYLALEKLSRLSLDLYISLLGQYIPCYKAKEFPEVNRKLTEEEFDNVFRYFLKLGFHNGWVQEAGRGENLTPDFNKKNPFT